MDAETARSLFMPLHAGGGAIALVTGLGAALTRKRRGWHTRLGSLFFWAMTVSVIGVVPIMWVTHNLPFFLIAIFSYYFAYFGRSVARRKHSKVPASLVDRGASWTALLTGVFMIGLGLWAVVHAGNTFGWVFVAFGGLAIQGARRHLKFHADPSSIESNWILEHLGAMGAPTLRPSRPLAHRISTIAAYRPW